MRASAFSLAAVVLVGCGNLTAGGVGDAEVYASGDADEAPTSSPVAPSTSSSEPTSAPQPAGAGIIEGTLGATLDLALIAQDGRVMALNGAVVTQMDLLGSQTPLLVDSRIPAERYTALRVRFTAVTASVEAGLLIGGIPYVGPVSVAIGSTALEVQVPVTFELEQGDRVSLLLDMNSDEWLLLLDVLTQTVAPADFAESLVVTVR